MVDLQARKLGIGGSDIASVFNTGYGCRRRLWNEKRGTPEDYPREENAVMKLGKLLEPYFAEEYAIQTGRPVRVVDAPLVHVDHPELRVNVDRLYVDGDRQGVLEIKSLGRASFYKYKREGLPDDYILQLQHGMLVTDLQIGSFAIGSRDTGELLHWDVERNDSICKEILTEGPKFWATVVNGPMPDALEPDDKRCQQCSWRRTCHGNALIQLDTSGEMPQDETLRPLLDEYVTRKQLLGEAEELVEETAEELKTRLGDRQAVMVGKRKVYFRPQEGRTKWDTAGLVDRYESAIKLLSQLNADAIYPPVEDFKDKGRPFRSLRIY